MRLWTVHPRYLDAKGIVAAWREALLAQKVLVGATKGYKHHPQLVRFRERPDPTAAIGAFLSGLAAEAASRGYNFDATKIIAPPAGGAAGSVRIPASLRIPETRGQLLYEWDHLTAKLRVRAPELAEKFESVTEPDPHPLFRIVAGEVRDWEKR